MGASVSARVSTVTNAISNEINKEVSASATANCEISKQVVEIGGDQLEGCDILFENKCAATAEAATSSVIKAASNALNASSEKTKTGFGLSASVSQSEVNNFVSNTLNEKCNATAIVNNKIENGTIKIGGNCAAPIKIVNTGNAKASCMTKAVIEAAVDAKDESKVESVGFGGDLVETVGKNPFGSGMASAVCSYSSCCCICCILLILGVIAYMKFSMVTGGLDM